MMKKTLIALAALAATSVFAQSSVSIVGFVDTGFKSTTGDTTAAGVNPKKSELAINGTGTTAIHFRGVEDLGGGMKALFQAEIDWNPTQSSTLNGTATAAAPGQYYSGTPFNGEQFLGLSGGFGSVKLGTPNSAALETNAIAQPFGTALGGGYSNTVARLGVSGSYGINQFVGGTSSANRVIRHEKTARYDTPEFSGFKASVEYAFGNNNAAIPATSTNTGNAADSNKYQAIGLKYNNGPLNVMFSNTKASNGANSAAFTAAGNPNPALSTTVTVAANNLLPGETVTHNFLAANYTFGPATVYAGYTTSKNNSTLLTANTTGGAKENAVSYNIAGKYVISSTISLMANYIRVNDKNPLNADANIFGLGADYRLSARTALYARYEGYKKLATNGAGTTAALGSINQNVYMLGVNHSF